MNELELYAKKHKRLHPEIVKVLKPLFFGYGWNPARAKIKIVHPRWGKLSGRGSPTAVFVIGRTIYMMRGAMNALKPVRNNNWNLSSVHGLATLAHEVFHTYQHDRDGFGKFIGSFVTGVFKSLFRSKKIYDHKFFNYEREAIKFERKVRKIIKLDDIKQFRDMR